jgi:hypothetical protein
MLVKLKIEACRESLGGRGLASMRYKTSPGLDTFSNASELELAILPAHLFSNT